MNIQDCLKTWYMLAKLTVNVKLRSLIHMGRLKFIGFALFGRTVSEKESDKMIDFSHCQLKFAWQLQRQKYRYSIQFSEFFW